MFYMRSVIRRLGNSQGVSIPKSILDEAGLAIDSPIEIVVDGTSIVLRKVAVHPRDGWAADAALVTYDVEDRDWLEAELDADARARHTW
jgi:antitoxin MazE